LCFEKIISLIAKSNLPQEDCDNYYYGFERLMNRILIHFEKIPVTSAMMEEFFGIKNILNNVNAMITKACEDSDKTDRVDKSDKSDKSDKKKPLGRHPLMTHQQNISRFTKLCDTYQHLSDNIANEDDIEINIDMDDINNNINCI